MSNKVLRLGCDTEPEDSLSAFVDYEGKATGLTIGVNVKGSYPHVYLTKESATKLRDYLNLHFPE